MTTRAVALGLVGAVLICAFGYYNDAIIRQNPLVGNHMPASVYGVLIIFLLTVNPLLYHLRKRFALTGRELAVALALTLAACAVPGTGLLRFYSPAVMLSHQVAKTDPGIKAEKITSLAPEGMFADVTENEDVVLRGFVQGLGGPNSHISMGDVPWYAWTGTLAFWLPLILLLWIALIALAVVVHQQWSQHEHLAYPVARFAGALLPGEGESAGGVLRNKLFWYAAGAVFAIHLNNYLLNWYPSLVPIPTRFDFLSLRPLLGEVGRQWWWGQLLRPRIYFTFVAFAYLLASDVSFSLGIGPFIYATVMGIVTSYGVQLYYGGWYGVNLEDCAAFGAFVGLMATTIYLGRQYYASVLRLAVRLPARDRVEPHAVWGARVFLLAITAFVIDLVVIGLDWPLAVFFTAVTVLLFVVMGRVIAETGLFCMMSRWDPGGIVVTILGPVALGPKMILIILFVSTIIALDPRESLMPFVVNSLKIVDDRKGRIGRVTIGSGAAIILGLAVAVPLTLYFQYDRGANMADSFATRAAPSMAMQEVARYKQRLVSQDALETSETVSGLGRILHVSMRTPALIFVVAGFALVIGATFLRLRSPRWPIHPVTFLVWGNSVGRALAASFLIGWMLKTAALKYGGSKIYEKLKPVMFGLVAGDMLAAIVPSIIGAVYYMVTGLPPAPFSILPS